MSTKIDMRRVQDAVRRYGLKAPKPRSKQPAVDSAIRQTFTGHNAKVCPGFNHPAFLNSTPPER